MFELRGLRNDLCHLMGCGCGKAHDRGGVEDVSGGIVPRWHEQLVSQMGVVTCGSERTQFLAPIIRVVTSLLGS